MNRLSIRYTGVVQGVGFRATARNVARRFAVTGWVRNEPEGSVLLEVQGEAGEIERYRADLRQTMARRIQTENDSPAPVVDGEAGFEIRR